MMMPEWQLLALGGCSGHSSLLGNIAIATRFENYLFIVT